MCSQRRQQPSPHRNKSGAALPREHNKNKPTLSSCYFVIIVLIVCLVHRIFFTRNLIIVIYFFPLGLGSMCSRIKMTDTNPDSWSIFVLLLFVSFGMFSSFSFSFFFGWIGFGLAGFKHCIPSIVWSFFNSFIVYLKEKFNEKLFEFNFMDFHQAWFPWQRSELMSLRSSCIKFP